MNDDYISSIILIVIFVFCSAFFSATETAFSCLSKARLMAMEKNGNKLAKRTLELSERYDKLLTSILVGNNIVNIAMASVSTVMFIRLLPNIGASVSTAVITIIVLIFGEISPKSLVRINPERFAMAATPVMQVLVFILTPVNFLFSKWQSLLRRVFRLGDKQAMTEDELSMLVEEVAHEGSIEDDERDMVRSVLAFDDQDAEDILTPRVDMVSIDVNASSQEAAKVFAESGLSRLPVCDGNVDHIVGILIEKDFYTGTGISSLPIRELMREPLFVPKSIKIDELFRMLQKRKAQMAVVSDEFGGTLGIITMEDILEELVGEIWDEHDEEVKLFSQIDENTCRISCSADMDQLEHFLDCRLESDSATTGGWVMEQLGKIPDEGDSFRYEDMTVTVTKISSDTHRVLEIEIRRDKTATE